MIYQTIKYLVVTISISILLSILLSSSVVSADSRKASKDELKLTQTIERFFTDWLIKRDVAATMKYVSPNAILSEKGLPETFKSKETLSKEDINKLFELMFSLTLQYVDKNKILANSINSSYSFMEKSDQISIKHPKRKLFELFLLNIKEGQTAQDFAFICKFDETPAFREAVGKPNAYYVMTNIRFSPDLVAKIDLIDKFPFEMVWIKEGNEWHILTIAAIED
jgi:hypothetical protein